MPCRQLCGCFDKPFKRDYNFYLYFYFYTPKPFDIYLENNIKKPKNKLKFRSIRAKKLLSIMHMTYTQCCTVPCTMFGLALGLILLTFGCSSLAMTALCHRELPARRVDCTKHSLQHGRQLAACRSAYALCNAANCSCKCLSSTGNCFD